MANDDVRTLTTDALHRLLSDAASEIVRRSPGRDGTTPSQVAATALGAAELDAGLSEDMDDVLADLDEIIRRAEDEANAKAPPLGSPDGWRPVPLVPDAAMTAALSDPSPEGLAPEAAARLRYGKLLAAVPDAIRRAVPDNETLDRVGVLGRRTRIGKHQATNWVHLRNVVRALDEAGMTDAGDTLIWQVWHRVNSEARNAEFYRIACAERDVALGIADAMPLPRDEPE